MKRFILRLLALLPTSLPKGVIEFETWANSIIELADMPNNDSMKFTLATMILHLDSTSAYKPKEFFIRSLKKAGSNQIAAQIMHDLKTKQQEEMKAQAAQPVVSQPAEATAPVVVSDESQK